MTAIVIPLVRATASPWENVEQTAAELCSKGAGESAAPPTPSPRKLCPPKRSLTRLSRLRLSPQKPPPQKL